MSVNWVSTIFGCASWIIQRLCDHSIPWSINPPLFWAKIQATTLLLWPKNDHQRSINGASNEREPYLGLHIWQWKGCIDTSFQSNCIGRHNSYKGKRHSHCLILKMSINRASMILGLESLQIQVLGDHINPESNYCPLLYAKILTMTLFLCPNNQCQRSINGVSTERQQSINRASTECERFQVFQLALTNGCVLTLTHNESIGWIYVQKCK